MKRKVVQTSLPCLPSIFFLMILALLTQMPKSNAATVIPVAVVTCSNCESADALYETAQTYWSNYDNSTPSGYIGLLRDWGDCSYNPTTGPSVVLVVSTAIAISGAYYACWIYPHGGEVLRAYPLTAVNNADAVATDNTIFARAAAQAGRITLPANLPLNGAGGSSTPILWESFLNTVLTPIGSPTTSLWHGIIDFPEVAEGTFYNTQAKVTFQIWDDDTITVIDSNGWSAKFQWNPGADPQWQLVPNSIRDANGNPVDTSTGSNAPAPGATAQPVGPIDVSLPSSWNDIPFTVTPTYDDPSPSGTITVGPVPLGQPVTDGGQLQCAALSSTGICPVIGG